MTDSYPSNEQSPDEHVAACPDCHAAIALLDHPDPAAEPPPTLREAVLSRARRRRSPAVLGVSSVMVPYAAQVALMDDLLAELSGLPAHRRWREQAGGLLERVSAGSEVLLGVEIALAGARPARAPLRQALIQRTFETWTHADDIRAATDRSQEPPRPEHVHMIAEFGLALLPLAMREPRRDVSATVVLTGPGGGTWTIPLSPASAHVAVLVSAGAVDFCRLLANRRPPDSFPYAAEGDSALARDMISAAATLGCD